MPTLSKPSARDRAAHLGPERRRPQVLDTALAIAVEHGVGEVTIGAIAKRLQVTRPVVYACFADRVEILTALLRRETTALREGLVESLYAARGDTPEEAFIAGFQAILRVVANRPDSWRVLFATPDPAVAGRFDRVRGQLSEAAAAWIGPVLTQWWSMTDTEAKLPILVEFLLSSSMAAARSLLDPATVYSAEDLGQIYGRMVCQAFAAA